MESDITHKRGNVGVVGVSGNTFRDPFTPRFPWLPWAGALVPAVVLIAAPTARFLFAVVDLVVGP